MRRVSSRLPAPSRSRTTASFIEPPHGPYSRAVAISIVGGTCAARYAWCCLEVAEDLKSERERER
jgi:hypothetical protein